VDSTWNKAIQKLTRDTTSDLGPGDVDKTYQTPPTTDSNPSAVAGVESGYDNEVWVDYSSTAD
jgi:hypothetical protein